MAVCLLFANLAVVQAKTVTPVVVTDVSRLMAVINEVPLTGTVTSPMSADLSSQVSGLVKSVLVDEGERVKKGDIILELDTELEALKLQAAIAQTRQSKLELADAKRRLKDAQRLARNKTISDNDVQALQAEVGIVGTALQRAQAVQQQQEVRLRHHQVRAPFSGVVSKKLAEAGEWITPGTAMFELIAIDNLRIEFQVPQSVYPKTSISSPISISLDAYSGKTIEAKISAIVPVSIQQARTFVIKTVLDQQDLALIPGMSAKGMLRLDAGIKAVTVSRDAVLRHPDGRITLWVVNTDNTVSERQVKIGLSFNGYIVIEDGLQAGERIVVQGNESLRESQVISIKQE